MLISEAIAKEFVFEHISSNDGLSNNLVRDITQDKYGYMWFATSGGLNRFNGHSFEIYKTIIGDTMSLSDSRLSYVFEDLNGYLWVRSSLGNAHRIDPLQREVINLHEHIVLPAGTTITDHYLSKRGDIWFLLNNGVIRVYYNGNNGADFSTQYFGEQNGLPHNVVNFIVEDDEGNIWMGTQNGVAQLMIDPEVTGSNKFSYYFTGSGISFLSAKVHNNKIYMGNNRGELNIYDNVQQQFISHQIITGNLSGNILSFSFNSKNQLLMGTDRGELVLYDQEKGISKYYNQYNEKALKASVITELFVDSYDIFWLVTDQRGVYQFNPENKNLTYFGLQFTNRIFLGEPDKQILFEDSNRDLWIGINGGGLFLYNREVNEFKQFTHNPNNTGSLSSDIVLSLFEDRSKNLWIGTSYGGINKISLKKENHLTRIVPVEQPLTGFDNYIRSVTTDLLGNVWVGTKAGKIYAYRNHQLIGTIPDDLHYSGSFPVTNVYCLFYDNDQNLWVGTKGNGIYVFKSLLKHIGNLGHQSIEVVHFESDPTNSNSISSNNIYSIVQDLYGQYWIASFQGGLDMIRDPFLNKEVTRFSYQNGSPKGIVSNEVRNLFFDRDDNLWIATSEGVSILEHRKLKSKEWDFINLSPSVKDPSSMSGKVIYQIRQTRKNDIILATLDGGMNRLRAEDFEKRNFIWQHFESSILSPNVYVLEEDQSGNIWLGTDNGLFRIKSNDGGVEKFKIKNSFLPLSFSESCSQVTLQNEIVMGSNDGFIIFHPDSILTDTTHYPLRFSQLEINGERILPHNSKVLHTAIEAQPVVRLNYSQNNITLYFSVLDYDEPNAIQYSYFLEGYDNFWSTPSTTNNATYRKLPPGTYTLLVNGTNSSGNWIKEPARLELIIRPPFWKSTAGYILVILIFSALITATTIVVYRQIIFQNSIKVEKAITEKRIEYYTNISHEFKTPLSLIISPVEEIILSPKSNDFARQKGIQIKKNAIYLKRLIEQILEFRKLREGKMRLSVAPVNLVEFFREIYQVFLPLSKKMDLKFEYEYNPPEIEGYADVLQLEKVVYNLLSNAFRFTPKGKHVKLKLWSPSDNSFVQIVVEDEGVGIDPLELPRIFERFYNSKSSSGIGLFFTKEIVLHHKGEIEVENNERGGASFNIKIPILRSAYSPEEVVVKSNPQLVFNLKSIDDIEIIVSGKTEKERIHHHVADYMETILIAEDNAELRQYLSVELSENFKVLEADNGETALQIAREKQPVLILSDVIMPKMNGYELTRRLKEDFDTSHIPVILLTAESSEEQKMMGVECGADDFVVKPFSLNYLLTKIEKTILQRKKLKNRFERDSLIQSTALASDSSKASDFMKTVQETMMKNLANVDLNVEFLVSSIGISRTLFFKKMKMATGYAPNEYMRIVKMKEAARMLLAGNKTISEISTAVGFNDSNYFGKTFKKHFGQTPSDFKASHSKQSLI